MKTKRILPILLSLCLCMLAVWGGATGCATDNNVQVVSPSKGLEYTLGEDGLSYSVSMGECTDYAIVIPSEYEGKPVTAIADGGFKNCARITHADIPLGVTVIGEQAFSGCSKLLYVTIPTSATVIGNNAFSDCDSLRKIDIPESVVSVGVGAFENCGKLAELTVADGVTAIGDRAFSDCGFENLTLPNSVVSIGNNAFDNCEKLKSITIPAGIKTIGANAFNFCRKLEKINYLGTIDQWAEITFGEDALLYAKNLYINDALVTEVNLTTATKISAYAFEKFLSITSVTIPETVTAIGDSAFLACDNITEITIPNSVKAIGKFAFSGCNKLRDNFNVYGNARYLGNAENPYYALIETIWTERWQFTECTINQNCKIIAGAVFNRLDYLPEITIPSGVFFIGDWTFRECDALTNVTFENPDGWYVSQDILSTSGDDVVLAVTEQNATLLTSTYCDYFWKRK